MIIQDSKIAYYFASGAYLYFFINGLFGVINQQKTATQVVVQVLL